MTHVGLFIWLCHSDLTEYLLGFIQVTIIVLNYQKSSEYPHGVVAREWLGMLPELVYKGTLGLQLKTYGQIDFLWTSTQVFLYTVYILWEKVFSFY